MVKGRRKKMVNKTKQTTFDLDSITNRPTPHLDEVQKKINKLLRATAASYIPEACEALRKDWNPTMSDDRFRDPVNLALQKAYREKILRTLCVDIGYNPDEGVWRQWQFDQYWPSFLKNPRVQEAGNFEKSKQARSLRNFQKNAQEQTRSFDRIADKLPEPPKEPEPDLIYPQAGMETWPSKYQKLGGSTKTSLTKMGDIRDACRELFTALTDKEYMPHMHEDLENDIIKPTREYRKFVYELDEHEQAGLYNWLVCTQAAINDMLEIIDGAKGKQE
jgi:hypothetical protein